MLPPSCVYSFTGLCLLFIAAPLPGHSHSLGRVSTNSTSLSYSTFLQFLKSHHKTYPAGSQTFHNRYKAFLESIQRQKYLNSFTTSSNASSEAYYGINQFSDLSAGEFARMYLRSHFTGNYETIEPGKSPASERSLPLRFDWRDKHVVMGVKNQMSCGGCWAFSVVGAVESAYAIQGHQLEDLSVQQVIDCSYMNSGCNGGSTVTALRWLNQTQAKLVRSSEYPFKAQSGICHYFSLSDFGVSIKGYEAYAFSRCEEEMMAKLVQYGPLTVIVDAVSWQDYLGGVIQHHCSSGHANHAVLVVGYDKTGDIPYWIIQNSWGTTWGVEGYVYVKMGNNVCDYYRMKKIPRGFRIRNTPTIGRNNPEMCRKWIAILNKCSLDLILLVIDEVGSD
uniref:Cathepsin O n=1 Tax=Leptobrachium leishanense TaxID=445787 RepID=A0A8C5LW19_9ANUR